MLKKIYKNKFILAFLLSFILGCLIIIPNMIAGDGIYHLYADFDFQEIPFHKLMNYSIKNNEFLWTWNNDFGSNFIATFSFYNLFSPFNLIGLLFSDKYFEYIIGIIFILKYAVTGLTSFLFMKRYVKNKDYAILGSLLYTFSGFQLTNILFYHFHDVVAFFPLLLYSLDKLIYEKKKGLFAGIIFLCAITNWFFFIGEIIFCIIYFIIKIITKDYIINKKIFYQITKESLLGGLMSMFIIIPTFIFTITNPRVSSNWNISYALRFSFIQYFEILRGMISSPETMSLRSILTESNYSSVEFYLPIVGLVLTISYFIKKPKKTFSLLFIISLVFMFIPILNSSFFLFTTSYYARWFYMPILIASTMSIKCLEEKISIKSGIITTIIIYLILGLFLFLYNHKYGLLIQDSNYLMIILFTTFISLIITSIISIKKPKHLISIFIFTIIIYVTLYGNYMVYKYQNNNFGIENNYKEYLKYNDNFSEIKNHQTNSSISCEPNISYTKRISNIRSFNSNISGSTFEFLKQFGIYRETSTIIPIENKSLNNLLGVKYIISCNNDNPKKYGYEYYKTIDNYKIYINNEYLPFGYSVSNYINEKDYNKLSYDKRIEILNTKVLLTDKQIKKYKNIFPNESIYKSYKFTYKKNGFISDISTTNSTLAIFQIPYDKGWNATINGKKIQIEKVNNGFMAIKLNKGKNKIKFTYHPKGLTIGLIISIISFIIYIKYLLTKQITHSK